MCKKSLEPLVKPKGSQTKKNSWNETKELRNQLEEVPTRENWSSMYISKKENYDGVKHMEHI